MNIREERCHGCDEENEHLIVVDEKGARLVSDQRVAEALERIADALEKLCQK